jgi:hypothetical protein
MRIFRFRRRRFMQIRKAIGLTAFCAVILLPTAFAAGGKFDGNWTTHLACEAHGETPAYKWEFPSEIKDNNFHGVHGEQGGPGYLVIEGKISDDGSAKLAAKGTVTQNHAHGVFAMKGNNYSYNIKAQFSDAKGTGTRDEGAGILGRSCTFEFVKRTDEKPAETNPATNSSPSPSGGI